MSREYRGKIPLKMSEDYKPTNLEIKIESDMEQYYSTSHFSKFNNDECYQKCNIDSYSEMNVENFFDRLHAKLARQPNEDWSNYLSRKYESEKEFDRFVFGYLFEECFELINTSPDCTGNNISNGLEFYKTYGKYDDAIGSISVILDVDAILNEDSSEDDVDKNIYINQDNQEESSTIYHFSKVNSNAIGTPFNYWLMKEQLLNNTSHYLKESCTSSRTISVEKWLTATGKKGRTKELELLSEGINLLWEKSPTNYGEGIDVISPNNIVIGEINWRNEYPYDNEYSEVYLPFITSGNIHIESITLNKIIPHRTPGGRPLKALAQVIINMKIDRFPDNDEYISVAKQDIRLMRKLAAIDYNRKCDIIEGIIPECPENLEELFPDEEFEHGEEFLIFDLIENKGFLSGCVFTSKELEEIWNMYMNIRNYFYYHRFHIDDECDEKWESQKQESETLFCEGKCFNYAFEQESEFTIWDGQLREKPTRLLKLYRKSDSVVGYSDPVV